MSSKKEILDFGWGDTRGLRQKILNIYKSLNAGQNMPLEAFGYPPYEGDPILVEMLKDLTQYLSGKNYEYVCVTAGCTHAVNAAIYAMSSIVTEYVATRDLYYPRYPNMIELSNLEHTNLRNPRFGNEDIAIIDSPSNPLGEVGLPAEMPTTNIIWDAAYHTPTYGILPGTRRIDEGKIFCGSLSKLTGINGIRIGWTATNDKDLHDRIQVYVKTSTCGVSHPSQYLAREILDDKVKLARFFRESANLISDNKEEILKLRNVFGSDEISNYGMFAFFPVDQAMLDLFDKAKVRFTSGNDCGADYLSVRINLANSNEQTKELVKRIKNADRRKKDG